MAGYKNVNLGRGPSPNGLSDVDKLDDYQEADFKGVTLSLNQDSDAISLTSPGVTTNNETSTTTCLLDTNNTKGQDTNGNIQNRQQSRTSSTSSARHFTRGMSQEEKKEFFAVREGAFEKAVEQCNPVILENLDGELKGAWLLTEIDHWDTEKERFLFVTDYSFIIMKYDFITLKLLDYKRLHLKSFDKVIVGELKYPENSLMPSRNQEGVRCIWNKDTPLPLHKIWNPWSREIPWVTYTSHPLMADPAQEVQSRYDVQDFSQTLVQAVQRLDIATAPPSDVIRSQPCEIHYEPVIIECYAGIAAAFHNANDLGFFKSRGKVSF